MSDPIHALYPTPQDSFHVTRWWSSQPDVIGYWGPSTSSIDWCESNYEITRFIAEFANTLSNLVFVALALYGLKKCKDSNLPIPLALCQVGVALVGIGSFAFHATLRYEWQLGDELPMIFCSCLISYVAFDVQRKPNPISIPSPTSSPPSSPTSTTPPSSPQQLHNRSLIFLPWLLFGYATTVSVVYLYYPNPVFHQIAYAFIQILCTFRVGFTLMNSPQVTIQEQRNRKDSIKCETLGTALFLLGFLIWNLDNLFCDQISKFKLTLGAPWSFLIEGHAWWHLLTGTGAYFIVVGIQLLSMTMKEGADGFELKTNAIGLPYVFRIPIHHQLNKRIA